MLSLFYLNCVINLQVQTQRAILFGTLPAVIMVLKPEYAIFATFAHFFSINVGFYDIDLSKLHYLLISNSLAWISCYLYFVFRAGDDYLGVNEIACLWKGSRGFYQLVMGYVMNYAITVFLARNKVAEVKMHETYQAKLLTLNKELETTNLKLQKTNADLRAALQEKENFILRFSHEIRNPLNSLLGNFELCYVKAQDHELKTMLLKMLRLVARFSCSCSTMCLIQRRWLLGDSNSLWIRKILEDFLRELG